MSEARPQAFSVRALTKRYDDTLTTAVHEVSFTVSSGSTAALVGPPGAGKTTILRMLLGLVEPSAGTASVGGRGSGADRGNAVVGAVLSPRGLHPARTVGDHLRVYAAALGAPARRVREVLEATGLTEQARLRCAELSTGQQTRTALATALLGAPPLLVLDDPAAGLEPAEQNWLHEFLRGHTRSGGTVLLTSQSLAAVLPVADRLMVLSEGTMVYQGTPGALRRSHPDRLVVAVSPPASPIALATMLAAHGFTDAVIRSDGRLAVANATEAQIIAAAAAASVRLDSIVADLIHPDRVLASLTRTATARPIAPYSGPAPGQLPQPSTSMPYGMPR